jgi:hypothetical protein
MDYSLLPPFMLREADVIVRDSPKIQLDDPSENDHALTFPETGFRIPLSLREVFSYFPTTKSTMDDLAELNDVYLLTPTRWIPHTDEREKSFEGCVNDEHAAHRQRTRLAHESVGH